MSKISVASSWLGIFVGIAIVFGAIAHSARTDPVGRVSTAHVAVHGIVISPYN
jgi:hypothetical protein